MRTTHSEDAGVECEAPAADATSPLVSVIVPSFNKRAYLGDTIDSVQSQTQPRWELIIIDDGSSDGSQDLVAQRALSDARIRLLCDGNSRGANVRRNQGVEASRSPFILFLDADDLLASECLANRLAIMQTRDLDFAVFPMQVFERTPGDRKHVWSPTTRHPLDDFLRHIVAWSIMQPIWRREFVKEIGGFDPDFRRYQDVEFHTRALLQPGVRFELCNGKPDCWYRIAEDRKVFQPRQLLGHICHAAVMYRDKFVDHASRLGCKDCLLGVMHRTYLQVLQHAKAKAIDSKDLAELEAVLFAAQWARDLTPVQRQLFAFTRWYNLLPIRIPGVNRLVFLMLTGRRAASCRKR